MLRGRRSGPSAKEATPRHTNLDVRKPEIRGTFVLSENSASRAFLALPLKHPPQESESRNLNYESPAPKDLGWRSAFFAIFSRKNTLSQQAQFAEKFKMSANQ